MKRKSICQRMKLHEKKVSKLVLDLNAKGSAKDSLRIKEVELMDKEAKKEFVDHKGLVYEALASYMERDVPEVNEVVHRSDDTKLLSSGTL